MQDERTAFDRRLAPCVSVLIAAGAQTNFSNGETALDLAVSAGFFRSAEAMLRAGVDIDELTINEDSLPVTALQVCMGNGDRKGIRFLTMHGADASIVNRDALS